MFRTLCFVSIVTLFPLLVTGCGGPRKGTAQPPEQVAVPAVFQEAPPPSEASQRLAGAEEPPKQPNPATVKLVTLDTVHDLDFTMLHPEGWKVNVTLLKDGVQILRSPLSIMISTRQLRGETPPTSEDEMVERLGSDVSAREVQVPGTQKAYEFQYVTGDSAGNSWSIFGLYLFGTTYYQLVTAKAPSETFMEWKPVFEQIFASFEPSNLDAIPLPGRP